MRHSKCGPSGDPRMRDGFKLKNEGLEGGVGEEADSCMLQEVAESGLCPPRRWGHAVRSHLLW